MGSITGLRIDYNGVGIVRGQRHIPCTTWTLLQRRLISLAWRLDREIRRRLILHETGFTRWRFLNSFFIYVEYSSGYRLFICFWIDLVGVFSTRVSDDRKYVCGRRLYACINSRKFTGLDSREITSLPEMKKVIYIGRHFNYRRKWTACSSLICMLYSFAYNESLQQATIAVFFRPPSSVHLFQSNQRFQAREFVDRHVSAKL